MKTVKICEVDNNRSESKRRLVLYLSGKWKARYADAFDREDYLYCAPGFAEHAPYLNWKDLPRNPNSDELLSEQYSKLLLSEVKELDQNVRNALINSHFYYGVNPIAAQLQEIDRLISDLKPVSLILISSKSGVRHVPAIGIMTSESNRGSPNLLGSVTANAILDAKLDLPVVQITANGDLLSNAAVRYIVLRTTTIALVLVAAVRIISSPIQTWNRLGNGYTALVSLRSVGQAGHAARIFDGLREVAVLVIPQFTGRDRMSEIAQIVDTQTPLFRPTAIDVFYALVQSIFKHTPVERDRSKVKQRLRVGRFSIPASLTDLSREMRLFPHLRFHKILVERTVLRFKGKIRKLVGFEIKGPFASIEAMAGRACGVETVVVQTVLTQPRPIPIFPWSDRFYADSIFTAETIKNTGCLSLGQVEYVGSPHSVMPLKLDAEIRSVVFMSQPYELPQTLSLLRSLCEIARNLGFQIRIRLHPRDHRNNYQSILDSEDDVLYICQAQSLAESISSADLCVTRTSSSAKEASAAGKPFMICLWSEFDRAIVADYVVREDIGRQYIANNAQEMRKIMLNTRELISANIDLHARLFGDKDLNGLRAAILG